MTGFLAARLYEPGKAAKASLRSGAIILRLSPSCQSAVQLSLGIGKPRGMIHLTGGLYRRDKRLGVCFAQLPGQPATGDNRNQAGNPLVQEIGPQARQFRLFCSKGWCPGWKSTSATADSRTDVLFGQHTLIASGFVVSGQLARLPWPRMKFVSLKSQVCLRLPPDPTSR